MPKSRLHHIHRIDSESKHTHSWRVQVQSKGRIVFQHFSDSVYGGKRKALQAAISYRDMLLNEMHDGRYRLWRRQCKRRNNTSGIIGVGRYVVRATVGGKETERTYWQASWDGADGKQYSRKFSVSKYGERQAKAHACAVRRQALAALQNH